MTKARRINRPLSITASVCLLAFLLLLSCGALAYVPDNLDFVRPGDEKKATAPVTPSGGKVFMIPSINLRMMYVPPGAFMMGSPANEPDRSNDENQHQVTLTKGFFVGVTEVTQGQWKKVMGNNPSSFKNCGDECPVESVSWNDVKEFIRKLNSLERTDKFRLPTEAEWEYACRAGTQTALYSGAIKIMGENNAPVLDGMDWYGGNSCVDYEGGIDCSGWMERQYSCKRCGPQPVARKQPNAWGLYDMSGNAWEWCEEWYGDYPSGSVTDPKVALLGALRGGGGLGYAGFLRSASRGTFIPGDRNFGLGFRLAKDP